MITEILHVILDVVGNVHDMIDEVQKIVDISTDLVVRQIVNRLQCTVHGLHFLIDVDEHAGEITETLMAVFQVIITEKICIR
jgi:hypothetical protein